MLGYLNRSSAAMLVAFVALVMALSGTASAGPTASPVDRKIGALQAQVRSLQKQVKALRVQVTLTSREVGANWVSDACLAASVADVFQGTWSVVDTIAQALQAKTYFGPQQSVNDYGACAGLIPGIEREKRVPPTISPFQGLINWIHG